MHRLSPQVLALLSCFSIIDLQGKVMMPIHNSTFNLSMHNWQDPIEQALAISKERDVQMVSPVMGARLVISDPVPLQAWWKLASNSNDDFNQSLYSAHRCKS